MKRAFILIGLGLLLPLAFTLPARAGEVRVQNSSPYRVQVSIPYHSVLCKDDHTVVAPGATWRTNAGACLVKKPTFYADGHRCESYGNRPGNPGFFVIMTGKHVGDKTKYCVVEMF